MEKKEVRAWVKKIIAAMPLEEQALESEKKCKKFLQSPAYKECDLLLSYMAMKNECDPLKINLTSLADNKKLALPRVREKSSFMDFYTISNKKELSLQLQEGLWGIREPFENKEHLFECDASFFQKKICVIVPGFAFTKEGGRLGRGKGFYDIYLASLLEKARLCNASVTLLGFCFDCQILQSIPLSGQDIRMDYVL